MGGWLALLWVALSHLADMAAVGLPTPRLMAGMAPPCPARRAGLVLLIHTLAGRPR
jgi:hypothetical protein